MQMIHFAYVWFHTQVDVHVHCPSPPASCPFLFSFFFFFFFCLQGYSKRIAYFDLDYSKCK